MLKNIKRFVKSLIYSPRASHSSKIVSEVFLFEDEPYFCVQFSNKDMKTQMSASEIVNVFFEDFSCQDVLRAYQALLERKKVASIELISMLKENLMTIRYVATGKLRRVSLEQFVEEGLFKEMSPEDAFLVGNLFGRYDMLMVDSSKSHIPSRRFYLVK